MRQLVTTEWLEKNINKVKILDATWCLPNSGRNSEDEFKENHIKNSIFFDIDKNSSQNSSLPHMLPSNKEWENILSNLGINNSDHVIIYDNSNIFSSCRVWYTFIYFGHNTDLVSVLDGNFIKWQKENRAVSKEIAKISKTNYEAEENLSMVIILIGVFMLLQPFHMILYSYSFIVILVGTIGFVITSHFPD